MAGNPRPRRAVEPAFLTVDQAAARIGVSRSTVYELVHEGRLTMVAVRGRVRRVTAESIEAFIEDAPPVDPEDLRAAAAAG
jgi:excisionase family DNA binding protein